MKRINLVLAISLLVFIGCSKEIIEIHIDGEHWINYNFDELLTEIKVIE